MSLNLLPGFLRRAGKSLSHSSGRKPGGTRRVVPRVEALEDRTLLTTTLYLDFGDAFPGGTLVDSIESFRTIANAGDNLGPRITHDGGEFQDEYDNWQAQLSSFNAFYGARATALRQDIVALVRRAYEPFDVYVVQRAASSLADIKQTLADDPSKASYMLVGQMSIQTEIGPFVKTVDPTTNEVRGVSSRVDIEAVANEHDGLGVVYLKAWSDDPASPGLDYVPNPATAIAKTIIHESGHLFGLRHTFGNDPAAPPPGSSIDVHLVQSDVMSYLTGDNNYHFFTRFPMPLGDGNVDINSSHNPYEQFKADPNVGASAIEYITGTGEHDIIDVVKISETRARVTVSSFNEEDYINAIPVPGGAFAPYEIDLGKRLVIEAGTLSDTIRLDADLGTTIEVRGMRYTDRLFIRGKQVASGVYEPNAVAEKGLGLGIDEWTDQFIDSYGGTLTFGNTTIKFSEFEPQGRAGFGYPEPADYPGGITVENVTNLTFKSPYGADEVKIDSPEAGVNRITGKVTVPFTSPAVTTDFVPFQFSHIQSFTLDLSSNDLTPRNDSVKIESPGLVASGLTTFTVTTGDGDDRLEGTSATSLPSAGGVRLVFDSGSGYDTIKGADVNSTWKITTRNEGTLNDATQFKNVENLTGGASQDLFKFEPGGSVDGSVDGGQAVDTLDFSALNLPRSSVVISGPPSIDGQKGGVFGSLRPIGSIFDNIDAFKWQAGVTIKETSGATVVEEGGQGDSYSVVLDSAPTDPVTIGLLPELGLTVSLASLIFTANDWDQPQTVTVAADSGAGDIGTLLLTHAAQSNDARYSGIDVASVRVTVLDDTWPLVEVGEQEPNNYPPWATSPWDGKAHMNMLAKVAGTAGWLITGQLTSTWVMEPAQPAGGYWARDEVDYFSFFAEPGDYVSIVPSGNPDDIRLIMPNGYDGGSYNNAYHDSEEVVFGIRNIGGTLEAVPYTITVGVAKTIGLYELTISSPSSVSFRYEAAFVGTFEAGLYQSADTSFDTSDTPLAQPNTFQGVHDTLGTGVINLSRAISLDPGLPYILLVADPNDRIWEGSGEWGHTSWLRMNFSEDIQVSQAALNDARNSVRFDYTAATTLVEVDSTSAMQRQFEAGLYRSANPIFDPATDTLVAKWLFDGDGTSGTFNLTQPIPADASRPYLLVVADPDNDVAETNENNNKAAISDVIPKVRIIETDHGTAVAEGGVPDRYSVVLTKKPGANVVVGINPGKQLRVSVTSLTFTPANWNKPQTVTVTAVDDKVAEAEHAGTIKHSWLQAPASFKAVAIPQLAVKIRDNDFSGVKISQIDGTKVKEGGFVDTYTIRLTSQPTANVTITLSPNPQLSFSTRVLIFTPANWNKPQTVTVRAKDDKVAEGRHTTTIKHTLSSADPKYSPLNLTIADVIVAIFDNEVLA